MERLAPPPAPARHQRGLTLVEVMVGIAIGLVILAAMSVLFATSSRTRVETERAGLKIDNGRHALDTLAGELQHAGFLAEFDPRTLPAPPARPAACETSVAALLAALPLAALGQDNVAAGALACLGGDLAPGTDVVVVRRAATCTNGSADCTPLAAGMPAFQASSCSDPSELGGADINNHYRFAAFPAAGAFTLRQRDCATAAGLRRYVVRIYFVARNDRDGDGIPSLKRVELGAAGWSAPLTLVQGVENLQVEWGLDTNGDGTPELYATDPDRYCASATPPVPAGSCWGLPVAARLYVLARNPEASPGHTDTRRYALGKQGDAATGVTTAADASAGPFNDARRRNVYTRTVALQNVTARRFSP
ncbi:PilW family protein [Ramlibacter sp. MAHUQ-53]|uniref:PilW family protein n=1 Tax=unclassified Ramlibacter TaxID=2617605 RepID=UPI0036373A48